ncbi:MAG: hypothetical protein LBV17_01540 [Treponema sp.]|jgi:hypothetical protein|nr:hypothetical protein [Treponema sp.]
MKKKVSPAIFLFCTLIFCACSVRGKNSPLIIVPELQNRPETSNLIGIDDITETQGGTGNANLPAWLLIFNGGGINALEGMEQYHGKYCFVGRNESINFSALSKWAEIYSETPAFTRLVAARIEKRLTSGAELYPDDEYGAFYEIFIKKAFDAEYPGASTQGTYWIKKIVSPETSELQYTYEFFVLISIDKTVIQDIIKKMIEETRTAVTPTRAQNNAIGNIQLHFFEGF